MHMGGGGGGGSRVAERGNKVKRGTQPKGDGGGPPKSGNRW